MPGSARQDIGEGENTPGNSQTSPDGLAETTKARQPARASEY